MDDYISKPIKPEELYRVIGKATRHTRGSKKKNEVLPVKKNTPFTPKSFNLSLAMEMVMDSKDLFKEIAEMFLSNLPDYLEKVREGIAENNADSLERAAHSLKGAVANFGAGEAYEAAYQLEKLGNAGKLDKAKAEMQSLEKAMEALASDMNTTLEGMANEDTACRG